MTDVPALIFVDQASVPEYFNLVLFGPMGSGKSTGAATANGPILWVNAQGPGSIRYPRKVAAERGTQIMEVEVPPKGADVAQILRGVVAHWKRGHEPRPQTIVVDTIGNIRDLLSKQFVVGPQSKTREQWGKVAEIIREFVLAFRDEPVTLILIAHESVEDAGDDRIVRPKIGGVLTEDIPAEMDVVGYCGVLRDEETGQPKYVAQFVESRGRRCKDRSNGLGEFREIDVAEWLGTFIDALSAAPAEDDVPFVETEQELEAEPDSEDEAGQLDLEAKAA